MLGNVEKISGNLQIFCDLGNNLYYLAMALFSEATIFGVPLKQFCHHHLTNLKLEGGYQVVKIKWKS